MEEGAQLGDTVSAVQIQPGQFENTSLQLSKHTRCCWWGKIINT